jgi:hypothetical protein
MRPAYEDVVDNEELDKRESDSQYRYELDNSVVQKARYYVRNWADNDEELRIPSNEFGRELSYSLRVIIQFLRESGR